MVYNIYTEHIKHEYTMGPIVQSFVQRMELKGYSPTYIYIFTNLFQGMKTNKHEHITCIVIYILYAVFL